MNYYEEPEVRVDEDQYKNFVEQEKARLEKEFLAYVNARAKHPDGGNFEICDFDCDFTDEAEKNLAADGIFNPVNEYED